MALVNKTTLTVTSQEKNRATAFVNWVFQTKDGREVRSDRGFPIFQNPDYPSKKEDLLVSLAERNGGVLDLNMRVQIRLNKSVEVGDIDLDDIDIL